MSDADETLELRRHLALGRLLLQLHAPASVERAQAVEAIGEALALLTASTPMPSPAPLPPMPRPRPARTPRRRPLLVAPRDEVPPPMQGLRDA
jgi:hypothetical protein